ncbi:MAG: arylesterase, partial [Betaproteobacteria bacterium]|nr:arylesterase [Betaproteobacteria bacterium]
MPRAARTVVLVLLLGMPALAWCAEKSILVFGDSLSASYGVAQLRGWVALLAERIRRERPDYSVANASLSGETTAGGLARLPRALAQHRPAVLVLELGGNDGLRGLPLPQMRANLAAMIEKAQKSGARVLLVGMRIPPNYGPEYTQEFEAAYTQLAKRYRTALLP